MTDIKYWKWDINSYPEVNEMSEIVNPSFYDIQIINSSSSGFLNEIINPYVIKNNKIVSVKTGSVLFNQNVIALKGMGSISLIASPQSYIDTEITGRIDMTSKPYAYSFVRDQANTEYYMFYNPIISKNSAYPMRLYTTINIAEYTDDLFINSNYIEGTADSMSSGEPVTFNNTTIYAFKLPGVFPCDLISASYLDSGTILGYDKNAGIIYGDTNDDIQFAISSSYVVIKLQLQSFESKNSDIYKSVITNRSIDKNKMYGIGL